ncbi:MAG: putative ABC exporter domain-containing protein [Lachnospiraceae bacterium]
MSSFLYLYQRTIVNRIKKSLKRPITYVAIPFIAFYLIMIGSILYKLLQDDSINTPETLVTVLSILIFLMIPSNIIGYAKRKGLLFRPSEIHFVLPSPVSPKMVLMFAGMKSFAMNLLVGITILICGIFLFQIAVWKMLLYFLLFTVFETILEASIIIFCYGNERLSETFFKKVTIVVYAVLAIVVGIAVYLMATQEASFSLIREYLELPIIQLIPIIGWNIAATRLIFLGPDFINIIGTVLFIISVLGMFLLAKKMKCTGGYYEDVMKFADDYQALLQDRKKGVVSTAIGKKKKFKKAQVEYKGIGAKAIYFRQLLEYKKNKFFIFGWNTLLCLGIGIGIGVVAYFNDAFSKVGMGKVFVIPAVYSYFVLICSGYATKWSKELENPYTYLIPDTSLKKIWYATKIEHIRSIIDGICITLPGALILGINPVIIILTIILYVCLMANRLYYNMLADAILGNSLGNMGRSFLKIFLQSLAIGIGIMAAAVGGIFLGIEAGFVIMILVMGLLTFAGAAGASVSFIKMEVLD